MSELDEKLNSIWDTDNPIDTKKIYQNHLDLYYRYSNYVKNLEDLIRCPSDTLQKDLEGYCMFLAQRVKNGELSPNSVSQKFSGIKNALENNYRENDIKWKPIKNKSPHKVKLSGYTPYTNEYVQKMLFHAGSTRNRAIILFQNSIGPRMGVCDHPLLKKHTVMMSSTFDDNLDCMAVILYGDYDIDTDEMDMRNEQDNESSFQEATYWGFLTPEATKVVLEYWKERENDGEIFTPDTPIFRATYRLGITRAKQVSRGSVSQIFKRVVESAKIPRVKKGRRYDIQLTHGNRKRFNTKLKLNNDVNDNVTEKLMAHKKGLDGVYLRPSRVEFFKEFVKAIPELTTDGTARKQAELEQKEKENAMLRDVIDKTLSDHDRDLKKLMAKTISIQEHQSQN